MEVAEEPVAVSMDKKDPSPFEQVQGQESRSPISGAMLEGLPASFSPNPQKLDVQDEQTSHGVLINQVLEDSESDIEDYLADEDIVLYENRPEWQDISPVPLAAGSVMPIAFSDLFKSVFGYFRAVLAAGELSARALRLCDHAAQLNPANYTVWMYRRKILEHLKCDLNVELLYISKVIEKNPKNYQVWYHRQRIVDILKDPSRELDFTAKVLRRDAKNYHVWQHRQFVLRNFHILDHRELAFTDGLIKTDPFNNSAWMHRFFVMDELPKSCGTPSLLDGRESLSSEVNYTLAQINLQIHNESPWSYLRGILRDRWASHFVLVSTFCNDLYAKQFRSPFLLGFMVDMGEEDIADGYQATTNEEKTDALKNVEILCRELAEQHDCIRTAYWNWNAHRLRTKFAAILQSEHFEVQ